MALSISGGDGSITSQAKTQTPQASVGPSTNATSSGNVQPGTASSLLTSQSGSNGISLTSQELPTVTVSAMATSGQVGQPKPTPSVHHINMFFLCFALLLFIIAAVTFGVITRSAKTTTK
jgi:hypothetical protein